jgi:hypothetical protein
MGNQLELKRARRAAENAQRILEAVENLPRRRGSKVTWSNGVVWTRVGDNRWVSNGTPPYAYPSAHVASGTIVETTGR